jgi:hypothetical protein
MAHSPSTIRYRPPQLLRDVLLLDLLELTGSTQQASRHLDLSQPSVSRRYQRLADDFALRRDQRMPWGRRFGSNGSIRHLRLAARAHRLAAGMVALGCDLLHRPLFEGLEGVLLPPARFLAGHDWLYLLREGVVDAALVPELELETPGPGVRVLPLGQVPLVLLARSGGWDGPVLAPPQEDAPGLVSLLERAGLRLQRAPRQAQHDWKTWCSLREPAGLRLVVPEPLETLARTTAALVPWPTPPAGGLVEHLALLIPDELADQGVEARIRMGLGGGTFAPPRGTPQSATGKPARGTPVEASSRQGPASR